MSLKSKDNDFVSEDRNWRSLILNELKCAQQWEEDWGFLSSGNALVNETLDDKIKNLESKLETIQETQMRTTAGQYGRGTDLERYREVEYNKTKNIELKPVDRRPNGKRK